MKKFKIIFPAGYSGTDILNDNIDINVVLEDGEVYFATVFTLENIKHLMIKDETTYFWADSLLISRSLDKVSLKMAVTETLQHEYFNQIFSRIGNISGIFGSNIIFEDIDDFSNGFDIR